jgi:carbonic anhydrase
MSFLSLSQLTVCALVCIVSVYAADWNYKTGDDHGPAMWKDECNLEDKNKQSSIDIVSDDAKYNDKLEAFSFSDYNPVDSSIMNNGHSVQVNVGSGTAAEMSGGGLDDTFKLAQFHFHWGSDDTKGSEHLLDGKAYPMEVHFVHYNDKYEDLTAAVAQDGGLAVLGFFFEVGDSNTGYAPIFDMVDAMVAGNDTDPIPIAGLDISKLMGSTDVFYRYAGGLTTPPCYESVTWTVFKSPIAISEAQMSSMRAVVDTEDHNLANNFRPAQPLGDREVHTNKDSSEQPTDGASQATSTPLVLLAGLVGLLFLC